MGQNSAKNRIRLKICDIECVVNAEDNEDYVRALGYDVERTIQELMGKNERVSLAMAAIIAALSYCDDVHKETVNSDHLRGQVKEYLDEATKAKEETARLMEENDHLRAGMDALCADILELKTRLEALGEKAPVGKSGFVQKHSSQVAVLPKEEKKEAPAEECAPEEPAAEIAEDKPEPVQENKEQKPAHHEEKTSFYGAHQPKPIPSYAPLQRPNDDAQAEPNVQTGSYSRPKSPFEPDLPSAEGFVSFFEKKPQP